jgi:hypothetical protein
MRRLGWNKMDTPGSVSPNRPTRELLCERPVLQGISQRQVQTSSMCSLFRPAQHVRLLNLGIA